MSTKTKKKTILIATAICLLAIAAFGTMAYFTSRTHVNNVFTAGNINVAMDESLAVETVSGSEVKWKLDENTRVQENHYYDVMAGDIIPKDPTVSNKGNHAAYLAVMIYVPKDSIEYLYSTSNSSVKAEFIDDLIVGGLNTDLWDIKSLGHDNDYYGYRLLYKGNGTTQDGKLMGTVGNKAGDRIKIFTSYKIPNPPIELDNEQENTMEMYIEAFAVQTAGFEDTDTNWVTCRNKALATAFGTELFVDDIALNVTENHTPVN